MADGVVAPRVVLFDDAAARAFEPFALMRPIGTLVSGTMPVWERWQRVGGAPISGIIAAAHLAQFDEAPGVVSGEIPAGTWLINSRFAPALESNANIEAGYWTCADRVVGVRLTKPASADSLTGSEPLERLVKRGSVVGEIAGWWHDEVWDYIRHLPGVLAQDIAQLAATSSWSRPPAHATVLGHHPVVVLSPASHDDASATVEPHVVFDTAAGPVLVAPGAHIKSFARIVGPCFIGAHTIIAGGDVIGSSIGQHCKIRGEISSTIMIGYSNKGHEGFIGHSMLGRWVNLGAGTTTSNLKNTYGHVALWTPRGIRPTGMQYLGTMFGDHVKTGIGTMLTTGTVLGSAANVYGTSMPPKVVAPFAWGDGEPYGHHRLDKFLESAERMMSRRAVVLTEAGREQLVASYNARWNAGADGKGE